MAFVLPTFNITCDIWTNAGGVPSVLRIADQPCQLRAPSMSTAAIVQPSAAQFVGMVILFPPLTDVRDVYTGTFNSSDWIDCPAGSGRWYRVQVVDDIGKDFANEHRFATLTKMPGQLWPVPIP